MYTLEEIQNILTDDVKKDEINLQYNILFDDETIFLDILEIIPNKEMISPQMTNKIRKKNKYND